MTETLIPLVLGAVLPPVIDLVNKHVPNSNVRFLIAVLFSFVVGAIIAFLENGWENLAQNAGLIFVSAQAVYKLWYEHSGMQAKIRN